MLEVHAVRSGHWTHWSSNGFVFLLWMDPCTFVTTSATNNIFSMEHKLVQISWISYLRLLCNTVSWKALCIAMKTQSQLLYNHLVHNCLHFVNLVKFIFWSFDKCWTTIFCQIVGDLKPHQGKFCKSSRFQPRWGVNRTPMAWLHHAILKCEGSHPPQNKCNQKCTQLLV